MAASTWLVLSVLSGVNIIGKQRGTVEEFVVFKRGNENHLDRLRIELESFCSQVRVLHTELPCCKIFCDKNI